jgi:hypothetical protein
MIFMTKKPSIMPIWENKIVSFVLALFLLVCCNSQKAEQNREKQVSDSIHTFFSENTFSASNVPHLTRYYNELLSIANEPDFHSCFYHEKEAYRLLSGGVISFRKSIRFEKKDSQITVYTKQIGEHRATNKKYLLCQDSFAITQNTWDKLKVMVDGIRFWEENSVVLDNSHSYTQRYVFEGISNKKYHFVERDLKDTAFLQVAKFIENINK